MCPVWSSEMGGDLRKQGSDDSPAEVTGPIQVRRSTQGRAGKAVIVISNLPGSKDEIKQLASTLKKKSGVGGSVKADNSIEIQGDILPKIKELLLAMGHKVKQIGG